MPTLNAVPILAPFVDWILDGRKAWEIRSRSTNIRGLIGLIKSKTLTVVGTCEILDVVGPLTAAMIKTNARTKMNEAPDECMDCVGQYAWVLGNVRRFVEPVPYKHPSGAVTWVKLDERKAAEVLAAKVARRTPSGSKAKPRAALSTKAASVSQRGRVSKATSSSSRGAPPSPPARTKSRKLGDLDERNGKEIFEAWSRAEDAQKRWP